MKKILPVGLMAFYFSTILTALNVSSQSFILKDDNNVPLSNGDTIVVTGPDTLYMEAGILVENISAVGKLVKVESFDLTVVPGAESFMMWGTIEYPPFTTLTAYGDSVSAFMTNNTFMSGYMSFGTPGTSWYKYIFFDENNPSDSAWAVIQYNSLAVTGIEENLFSEASVYPSPGSGMLNVLFSPVAKSNCIAEVFNSTGDLVVWRSIDASTELFCIDITKFRAGIYFLKLTDQENYAFKTWKIVRL
jgi:hypothetical protein